MDGERDFRRVRARLIAEIEAEARDTVGWTGRAAFSGRVMAAMAEVPRHEFVPPDLWRSAYVNRPLPIGHGQTISQPYIVALMTDLLDLAPDDRVLEIGTGCGYQAAVLARCAGTVDSVEVVTDLARDATERLSRLGFERVRVHVGDGRCGWPPAAPFDAVIVTAAPERMPPALIGQLAPGGRLVIPIGPRWETQSLVVGRKDAEGRFSTERTLPVAFVPLVGRE